MNHNRVNIYLPIYVEAVEQYYADSCAILRADLVIWFIAQGIAESGLNPNAESDADAKGIMQILDTTFSGIRCVNPDIGVDIFDARTNIFAGVFYDQWLWGRLHKVMPTLPYMDLLEWVFASYNWRLGLWQKFGKIEQKLPLEKCPKETQKYIIKIKKFHDKLCDEDIYFAQIKQQQNKRE